jgi:hypothetical protein
VATTAQNKKNRRRDGIDSETQELVDQLTLRKLEYSRQFLKRHATPRSGTRVKVRGNLVGLLEETPSLKRSLRSLLEELDVWGNQRVRLREFPTPLLQRFGSKRAVRESALAAGMSKLLDGEIPLVPPEVTTPYRISYEEREVNGNKTRVLILVAAKTRTVLIPAPEVGDLRPKEHPGIVFKPYREETQRAIDFAEINLDTGASIISTPLIRPGSVFNTEFESLYRAFLPMLDLGAVRPLQLYKATEKIRTLPLQEVRLRGQKARTRVGGSVDMFSQAPEADMRSDPELLRTDKTLPTDRRANCNCYWEPAGGLSETVHTLINAPEAEVIIMGQIREENARHVLRRIIDANR